MLPSEKIVYSSLIDKNKEISNLILERKNMRELIKYIEELTNSSLNLYSKSIKDEIPEKYLEFSRNFSEELIWDYATRWELSRNSYNYSGDMLWETLKQQYLLIYMMRCYLVRVDINKI